MIKLQNISRAFYGENVLKDVSFELQPAQTLSILGKSGCGKTTLLKIMAGMQTADTGSFTADGKEMLEVSAQKRGVVYLSQEPLLFPHLNVFENLAYGLKIRKFESSEIRSRVNKLAAELELSLHLKKMPDQLSGGQKQRVSFGRAMIINPAILLLDEPFGSLDAHTRKDMQQLYKKVSHEHKITSLFVTHDLKEALVMGDQIGRMEAGELNIFASIKDFVNSSESGVSEEFQFWRQLRDENDPQSN